NAMPPYSTSPTPATVMMKAANSFGGRYSMISHNAGSAMAAVSSRVRSRVALHRAQPLALELGARASEAPLPLLEECQRLEVLALAEVGPQRLRDVHLGVGELPEEEVADAHLAAGADQQVGVGHTLGARMLRDGLLRDLTCLERPPLHPASD